MQLLNTLLILATASFTAAAPAPSPALDTDAFRNLPNPDTWLNLPSPDTWRNLPSPDTMRNLPDAFSNLPKLPPGATWQLTGFGNPDCQGAVVWTEHGSSPGIPDRDCKATTALAASYRWFVSEPTRILTWPAQSVCVPWGADVEPLTQNVAAGGEGCVTVGVYAIGIAQGEAL